MSGAWWSNEHPDTVSSDSLTAVAIPGRGGKLASLVDGSGLEWLSQPALPVPAPSRAGARFTDAEMCGWDECAPSVDATRWHGVEIPDHGDLWTQQWQLHSPGRMSARGPSLGYTLERAITATSAGLRLQYRARGDGPAVPLLWTAHPQFVSPPGTRVVLADAVTRVRDVLTPSAQPLPWSADLATIDSVPPGGGRKVYVDPDVAVAGASLVRADGRALHLTWSAECRYLGLWFDNGAHSRESVIAIEPSTGYYDSLTRAAESGRVTILEADRELTWWLEISASQ